MGRRRTFEYWTLFLFLLASLVCVGALAVRMKRAAEQREAADALVRVLYDYQIDEAKDRLVGPGVKRRVDWMGEYLRPEPGPG